MVVDETGVDELGYKHILIVYKLVQAQMAESVMTESCKGGYICSSKVLSCTSVGLPM